MLSLLRVVTRRPELVLDHLGAYANIVRVEGEAWVGSQARRAMWASLVVLGAAGALLGGGLALLALALMAPHAMHAPGLLWILPSVPAVLAVAAWWQARRPIVPPFHCTREQLRADAQLLRDNL